MLDQSFHHVRRGELLQAVATPPQLVADDDSQLDGLGELGDAPQPPRRTVKDAVHVEVMERARFERFFQRVGRRVLDADFLELLGTEACLAREPTREGLPMGPRQLYRVFGLCAVWAALPAPRTRDGTLCEETTV